VHQHLAPQYVQQLQQGCRSTSLELPVDEVAIGGDLKTETAQDPAQERGSQQPLIRVVTAAREAKQVFTGLTAERFSMMVWGGAFATVKSSAGACPLTRSSPRPQMAWIIIRFASVPSWAAV
jgi:hypothetical protein